MASLQRFVPATCTSCLTLCDMLRAQNISQIGVAQEKSISLHKGTCRCNISLGHVPATFSCVCKCCDFVLASFPCYVLPQCALHTFLSLQPAPATLPLI